ncbi:MAG: hypothetical protein A3E01_10085 [Gammaproteobacteria bacterium RIFCSPHIGHO2_12_FULL_63_22]|nr:MAG: hypothetical protein A3E01_10085 [Gammaproteobacteria bacterium RIFCSPHIGHO2_12_FULL_63_22]
MKFSYPLKDTFVSRAPVTNAEIADEFCDQIADLTAKEAANIAGRSVPAAKKWKAKVQAPDSASLITSARRRPRVRAWLMWKIGSDDARIQSPQVLAELHTLLLAVGVGEGREAVEARKLYREIFRPPAGTEASAHPGPVQSSDGSLPADGFERPSAVANTGGPITPGVLFEAREQ